MRVRDSESSLRDEYLSLRVTPTELARIERLAGAYFNGERAPAIEYVIHLKGQGYYAERPPLRIIPSKEEVLRLSEQELTEYLGFILDTQIELGKRWTELASRKRPIRLPARLRQFLLAIRQSLPLALDGGLELGVPRNLVEVDPITPWTGDGPERQSEAFSIRVTLVVKAYYKSVADRSPQPNAQRMAVEILRELERELGLDGLDATAAVPTSLPLPRLAKLTGYHGHIVHGLLVAWCNMPPLPERDLSEHLRLMGELQDLVEQHGS